MMADGGASASWMILLASAIFAELDDEPLDGALDEALLELHPARAPPVRVARASTPTTRVAMALPGLEYMPLLL
jgi:hypothetical protein